MSVSLVMTVYNGEKYLAEAINSILNQNYKDWELIIWLDGCKDGSSLIARSYKDSRIKIYESYVNEGHGRALVNAFNQCSNEYVGVVDADDMLAPTAVAECVEVLDKCPAIGLVYTNHIEIDEYGNELKIGANASYNYYPELLLQYFISFHFRLFRKSLYDFVGGIDFTYEVCQDYDFCLRMSEVTNFFKLKRNLYYYRKHSEQMTNVKRKKYLHYKKEAARVALRRRGLDDRYYISEWGVLKKLDRALLPSTTQISDNDPLG